MKSALIADNSTEIENERERGREFMGMSVCTHVSLCVMWENDAEGEKG